MHAFHKHVPVRLIKPRKNPPNFLFCRHVSLNRAIGEGIRKTASALTTTERRRIRDIDHDLQYNERRSGSVDSTVIRQPNITENSTVSSRHQKVERHERVAWSTKRRPQNDPRVLKSRAGVSNIEYEAPRALPYSAAATDFIYGTFAVLAALKASRRKFYRLFIWAGDDAPPIDAEHQAIIKAAKAQNVPIKMVAGTWDKILEKLSGRRPHNGFVLETSRLPQIPVKSLNAVNSANDRLEVTCGSMDKETRIELRVNFSSSTTCTLPKLETRKERYPLLLFLDRIVDSGNMGAILRTAYFLGVEAILVPEHGTAPLSAVTVKASAGAAEHIPVLSVRNEVEFMQSSQEQGWVFFAASGASNPSSSIRHTSEIELHDSTDPFTVLRQHPCVLMLGNEGTGLRPNLQRLADYHMSIPNARRSHEIVDSLNVSVAAAMLIDRFLLKNEDIRVMKNRTSESETPAPTKSPTPTKEHEFIPGEGEKLF